MSAKCRYDQWSCLGRQFGECFLGVFSSEDTRKRGGREIHDQAVNCRGNGHCGVVEQQGARGDGNGECAIVNANFEANGRRLAFRQTYQNGHQITQTQAGQVECERRETDLLERIGEDRAFFYDCRDDDERQKDTRCNFDGFSRLFEAPGFFA
jgi:hypothetical protein